MKKRKKYLIDKKFQAKMIFMVVCLIMGAIVLSGVFSYVLAIQIEKRSKVQLYGATDEYQDDVVTVSRLQVVRPVVVRSLVIGGITGIIMAAVSMLFYSHRLAGPVYRLERHLEKIIDGNYDEELHFRKKDEFKQLADIINRLEDELRKKL